MKPMPLELLMHLGLGLQAQPHLGVHCCLLVADCGLAFQEDFAASII